MINLKEHNDLVERLMADNDRLENELKEISIKLRKSESAREVDSLKDREFGRRVKDDGAKLQKMQKQFKDKIDQMSKIVLARDLEITELKQRLDMKLNIDEREKEHLVETFRKWQGRKPNSSNDYKVMSVINHYENQLTKLNKQIDQLREDSTHHEELSRTLKRQLLDKENQDINIERLQQQVDSVKSELDGKLSQFEIDRLNKELLRRTKKMELVEKECGELRNRYEDLLKQYYRMVNEYGELNKPTPVPANGQRTFKKQPTSVENKKSVQMPVKHTPVVHTVFKKQVEQEESASELSLSYSQTSQAPKLNKLEEHPSVRQFSEVESSELQRYREIISRVLEIHQLRSPEELVQASIKLDLAIKNLPKMEACLASIKQAFQRLLGRKTNLARTNETLTQIETLVLGAKKTSELVRAIEIKVGSDRQGLLNSLDRLLGENKEYYNNLKSISFVKNLELSKQIQQFIEFFDLDSNSPLPDQIMGLYKQLKSLNTFVEICNRILETDLPATECLEHIMKLLERMKMGNDKADYDLLSKIQQELHTDKNNLLTRVRELATRIK